MGHEDVMLHIIHQKGPLGINVDAVLWHDYIGESFLSHSLVLLMIEILAQLKVDNTSRRQCLVSYTAFRKRYDLLFTYIFHLSVRV